jgi:tetratricopeptide (TPR) repeat protein
MLPPDVALFTGRNIELDRLDTLLNAEASAQPAAVVISAIAGSPGIGKTALALRWAHRVQDRFPDGQLYVNLRGYDPGSPVASEQALAGFLHALNVSGENIPRTVDAMASYFRSLVAGRRILVILDNAASPEQVRPLLPASPTCMVLITSRSRLSGLVARDGAHRITLDLLPPTEAIMLLRTIIGASRADYEPDATIELARRCAYLPLALRIAAERVADRPDVRIIDLVNDLSIEQNRLDMLAADDDETTAVRTVFSWSYRVLPRQEACVFRLLGLHPGPDISAPAAAALIGTSPSTVRRRLDLLAGVHLLEQTGRDRYQFHDLIRAYAAESVATEESATNRHAGERRVLNWYLHTTMAARHALYPQLHPLPVGTAPSDCQPLAFAHRADAVQWYDTEHENVVAAIRYAASAGYDIVAWQLPAAVAPFLILRSHWAVQISVQQIAVAAARRLGDDHGEFWSLVNLGEAHYLQLDRYDEAVSYLRHALDIAKHSGSKWGEGCIYLDLGNIALRCERFEDAIAYLRPALGLLHESNDKRGEALTSVNLATALRRQRRFEEALDHAHRGLAVFRNTNNRWNEALALGTIGAIHLDCQQFD